MIDIQKFYIVGEQLAGDLGKDLVHICYEKFMMLEEQPKTNVDGYFYSMMKNQVIQKSSSFNKDYRRINKKDFDTLECEYHEMNTELIEETIQQLKKQGYYIEVKTFEELAQTRNYLDFTRKTGVRYETLIKITTFVRKQILNEQPEPLRLANKTRQKLNNYFRK